MRRPFLSLDKLGGKHRIALVSNIDDDLLQATPVPGGIDLVCTAERARGYKLDGTPRSARCGDAS
jgi:2-haloacid dehalogenase